MENTWSDFEGGWHARSLIVGKGWFGLFQAWLETTFFHQNRISSCIWLRQAQYRAEIQEKYPELFNTSSVGKLTATKVTLRVKDDAPVYIKARTMPFAIKQQFDVALDK